MRKDELFKEYAELKMSYDDLWHMKNRYKDKWEEAEAKLDRIYKDLEQFMEGIKVSSRLHQRSYTK